MKHKVHIILTKIGMEDNKMTLNDEKSIFKFAFPFEKHKWIGYRRRFFSLYKKNILNFGINRDVPSTHLNANHFIYISR